MRSEGGSRGPPAGPPRSSNTGPGITPHCTSRGLHVEGMQSPKDADAWQEGPGQGGYVGKLSPGGRLGGWGCKCKGQRGKAAAPPHTRRELGLRSRCCLQLEAFLGRHLGPGTASTSRAQWLTHGATQIRRGGRPSVLGLPLRPWLLCSFPPQGPEHKCPPACASPEEAA